MRHLVLLDEQIQCRGAGDSDSGRDVSGDRGDHPVGTA